MNELDERNESVKSRNWPRGFAKAVAVSCLLLLAACGDDDKTAGGTEEDAGVIAISEKTVSGVSQKGPFVNGSSVTVQELDGETLTQTGLGFEGKIKSDLGEFSVKVAKLASQYALLKANGFYRNEVTGEKSKSQVTLYALTDLSDRDEVNVNLLTHLTYERSLYLASDGISVGKAKKQAESEVLASFGIDGEFANAEDLDIFGDGEQNAALLAVSVLMQGTLNEADFSERLANYAADIETDGKWDDIKTETQIADWASELSLGNGLAAIRNNIVGWNLSSGVPPFEKYVDIFWWQNYGLGSCVKKREGEVLQADNTLSMNHGVHFICSDGAWRVASDIEKDTYKWMDSDKKTTSKDGDVKYGDVVKTNCYVFENEAWRVGNAGDCSLGLRGCTKLRADTVGLGSDKVWYTCENKAWRKSTDIEKDTATWGDGNFDGEVRAGQVNENTYYMYETVEGYWREATTLEKDTYDYEKDKDWAAGNDGDSKWGSVGAKNCYVFENKAWRAGNNSDCSLELRGCTVLRQDTVGLGSDKVWHICDAQSWRNATTYEKDTFGWADTTDGAIRKGYVTDSVYVFDKDSWRAASAVEGKLGGCVSSIADSVGVVSGTYYICKNNAWTKATAIEYDTYRWAAGNDGEVKSGSINKNYAYVYINSKWHESYLNPNASYDLLTDERDGQLYHTIKIGSQIWMAEDLRYIDSNQTQNLRGQFQMNGYGEIEYTHKAALDMPKLDTLLLTTPHQGICPKSWHIPSHMEWQELYEYEESEAKHLKSIKEWKEADNSSGLSLSSYGDISEYSGNEVYKVSCYAQTYYEFDYDVVYWFGVVISDSPYYYKEEFFYEWAYVPCEGYGLVRCVKD